MSMARRAWLLVIAVEATGVLLAAAWRLAGWRVPLPEFANYHDSATASELALLPERFLFDSPEKWKTIGEAYMAYGHFAVAEACLARAAAQEPASSEIVYHHALCLERLGALDEARDRFEQVARRPGRLWPARAWYRVGLLALRAEQAEQAQQAFAQAGEEHLPSRFQRAKLWIRGGEPWQAEPLLRQLGLEHPDDLNVLLLRARWAESLGRADEAANAFDAAERARATLVLDDTELFLKPVRQQFGLVRELAHARSPAAGRQDVARLGQRLLADPLWRNFYLLTLQEAAALQLALGETKLARQLLERQVREQQFPSARWWELQGDLLAQAGQDEAARDAWRKAARMAPLARVHRRLAELAARDGDLAAASVHRQAAWLLAGHERLYANQADSARELFQQVVEANPSCAEAWYLLGETSRLRGDDDAAQEAYERCLALDPNHGRAWARQAAHLPPARR